MNTIRLYSADRAWFVLAVRTMTASLICLALLFSHSFAQDRTNIRGVGMARAMNAAARGVDAVGVNPSLLATPDNRFLEIAPLQFSLHARSDFISYDVYNDYFTGVPGPGGKRVARFLSSDDKNRLLSLIPNEGETRADVEYVVLGIGLSSRLLGGIGFTISDRIGVQTKIDKDNLRFFLFGLDSSGSDYDLSSTSANAWMWRAYSFSYSRQVPSFIPFVKNLYVGLGYKMIRGYGLFETDYYSSSIKNIKDGNQYAIKANSNFLVRRSGIGLLNEESNEDFQVFPEPAGKGTGLDFGLTMDLTNGIRVSASMVNIGSIDWDKNLVETTGGGGITVTNPFSLAGGDSLKEALGGKNKPGKPFSTKLPTQIRLGAAMRSDEVAFLKWLPGKLFLAADYTQGTNTSLGNSTKPRVALGVEYRLIPLLPLRTGIAAGGGDSFRWALGFGLDFHFVSLDFGLENFGLLFSPKKFDMFELSAGLRIRV